MAGTATSAAIQSDRVVVAVRGFIDGDTLVVGRRPIGLLGIDAPELRFAFDAAAPFAREARDRLASLIDVRFVRRI